MLDLEAVMGVPLDEAEPESLLVATDIWGRVVRLPPRGTPKPESENCGKRVTRHELRSMG